MSQPESAALAEQHRQAQLGLRARALRDFLTIWPLWTGDNQSFGRLVQATLPLVSVYRQVSASLAASFYSAIRGAHDVVGQPAARLAAALAPQQLATSMYVTGQVMTRDALAAGQTAELARRTALTRVSGAVTRHILDGGRETVIDSVAADPQAVGWARLTDGNPCAWCAMLASRGAVYKTEESAGFEAHDHCGCSVMPMWKSSSLPDQTQHWRDLYNQAQREGEASGDLQPGENSSTARLNAFRRFLSQHQP